MWTTLLFSGTAGLFLIFTFFTLRQLRWVRRLPALSTFTKTASSEPSAEKNQTRCSIVIAARNEESRIERTIRQLITQRGVELEIIVVDDRSTDQTGEILRRLALEHAGLRVLRVDVLPDGWLGKCNACHMGASAANHDWILFTDGDCWLKPDLIARALRVAEHDTVDHVTVVSGLAAGSTDLKASHLMFLISLANWFSGVNRDRPGAFLGIGAFNLVRKSAYRQCGGYEALRLTVVDDVKLGLLLRRAGRRTRAFIGGDDLECHWGTTAWGTVKIMEKNYFAALDYRTGLVLAAGAYAMLVLCVLLFGLITGTGAGVIAAVSPLSLILPAAILARRLGWSWTPAILVPFMFPLLFYSVLNSTFVTLRQGGIRWRETFYPLATLRAGNVR